STLLTVPSDVGVSPCCATSVASPSEDERTSTTFCAVPIIATPRTTHHSPDGLADGRLSETKCPAPPGMSELPSVELVEMTPVATGVLGGAGSIRDETVAVLLVGSASEVPIALAVMEAVAPAPAAVRLIETSVKAPRPASESRAKVTWPDET